MRMGRDEGRAGVTMFHTGREEAIILYPNSGRMNFWKEGESHWAWTAPEGATDRARD